MRTRQWTRAEYDRLIEIGVFHPGDAVELLGGEIIVAEPQNSPHYTAIGLAEEALRPRSAPGWLIRTQGPIALDAQSEPEPDVAVASGSLRDYSREHPARPVLIVEVAASSLSLDRNHKGSLYARARLEDYWIVNLVDRALEVYRQPLVDAVGAVRMAVRSHQTLEAGIVDRAAGRSGLAVPVADLLP